MSSGSSATSDYTFKMRIPPGFSIDDALVVLRRYNDGKDLYGRYFSVMSIVGRTRVATIRSDPGDEEYLRNVLPGHIDTEAEKLC